MHTLRDFKILVIVQKSNCENEELESKNNWVNLHRVCCLGDHLDAQETTRLEASLSSVVA